MKQCIESVFSNNHLRRRCSRNAVNDGYCKQHHPDLVKARRARAEKAREKKLEKSPLRMAFKTIEQLQNRIKELEKVLGKLATASDCYLEGEGDAGEFADTIIEAERLHQKQAGFKDEETKIPLMSMGKGYPIVYGDEYEYETFKETKE